MRVLVVEDEPFARQACAEYLNATGLDTVATGSASEALILAKRHKPQVLLCDWQLGDGPDGVALAKDITAAHDCHVLMMTGQPLDKLRKESATLKVHAFFRKPISLRDLSSAIFSIPL